MLLCRWLVEPVGGWGMKVITIQAPRVQLDASSVSELPNATLSMAIRTSRGVMVITIQYKLVTIHHIS